MELEYEGELHGAEKIGRELIGSAARSIFRARAGGADVEDIVAYFEEGGALQVSEDAAAEACVEGFGIVPGLLDLVKDLGLAPKSASPGLRAAACELVLEGLAGEKRISRSDGGYARAPHEGPKGLGGSLGLEGF
jgi:magnesium chelatase subunit I